MGVSLPSTPTSRTASRIMLGVGAVFAVGITVALFNTKKPSENEERESPAKGGSRHTRRAHRVHRNKTRKA